jgi:hypothetical protein
MNHFLYFHLAILLHSPATAGQEQRLYGFERGSELALFIPIVED